MTLRLLTVFLILLVSFSAGAENKCDRSLALGQEVFSKLAEGHSLQPNRLAEGFHTILNGAKRVLGDLADFSIGVVLKEKASVLDSDFAQLDRAIKMGSQDIVNIDKHVAGIFLHELGHPVFYNTYRFPLNGSLGSFYRHNMNLTREYYDMLMSPRYKEFVENLTELHRQIEVELAPGMSLGDLKQNNNSQALKKAQDMILQELPIEEYSRQVKRIDHELERTAPYQELFSDILAAYLLKDPSIIIDGFERYSKGPISGRVTTRNLFAGAGGNKLGSMSGRIRDFSVLLHFKDWKYDYFINKNNNHQINDYTMMDPVRGVIWVLYLKNLPLRDFPLFLKEYILAVETHVQQNPEEMTAETRNRKFLKTLVSRLNDVGIRPIKY